MPTNCGTRDQVSRLLGDRARLFENLARLNCLLNLVHLHLLGLDDPAAYARLMRENHLRHEGSAPPRRAIDGAGFETLPAAASAGPRPTQVPGRILSGRPGEPGALAVPPSPIPEEGPL